MGMRPRQSEAGSGLAPFIARARPSTVSVPLPLRVHSSSRPASSSAYRFPSWGPSPREGSSSAAAAASSPSSRSGAPPQPTSTALAGARTTTTYASHTALCSFWPDRRFMGLFLTFVSVLGETSVKGGH
jgi:hypothetical protein